MSDSDNVTVAYVLERGGAIVLQGNLLSLPARGGARRFKRTNVWNLLHSICAVLGYAMTGDQYSIEQVALLRTV